MADQKSIVWPNMHQIMFPEHKWVDAVRESEGVLKLLSLAPGAKILDVPCGIGRHSIQFSKAGFQVTGVDITPSFLAEAQKRALEEKAKVEWIEHDMLTFRRENTFDAVVNLYTSFGYFRETAQNEKILENFLACLKPGGKFLIDLISREIFQKNIPETTETKRPDGSILRSRHRFPHNDSWLENTWTSISKDGETVENKVGMHVYSREELCGMMGRAGFEDIKAFGDFDGTPYSIDGVHLLVLARK